MSFINRHVGVKIAWVTSLALLFVTGLLLVFFQILDVQLLSKFTVIQLIISFVCLLVFVEVLLVVLATIFFVSRPLNKLINAMRSAEEGNFLVRAPVISPDELGELSVSFNAMLAKITDLDVRKIDTERALIMAQESLKYKQALEEKAQLIASSNLKLESSVKDLSVLFGIAQTLGRALEFSEFLQTVSRIITDTLQINEFSLLFFNQSRTFLEVHQASGFQDNEKIKGMTFRPGEGLSGLVAQTGELIYVEDTTHDPRYLHYKGEKSGDGSFVSLPLLVSDVVVGVLNVSHVKQSAFTKNDLESLKSVGSQIALAYERSRLYTRIKELSITDELTGLYNRRHFQNVLHLEWKRALRFNRPMALMMIDVDFFKKYNDTFGHLKGDEALKKLARILFEHVREVDTVARFGGEEFVVLLPDTSLSDAVSVAEKLRSLVERARNLDVPENTSLTISIGVAAYPEIVKSEEDLLNAADKALYQSKDKGRNCVTSCLTAKNTGNSLILVDSLISKS